MTQLYDEIGIGYSTYRQPDPRLAAAILHALGSAASVVNVGASTGSSEPSDRRVVAVEPALAMIRQLPAFQSRQQERRPDPVSQTAGRTAHVL